MSLHKILIVEDQRIVAKDLEVRLQKLGYEIVDSVITGNAAIESARKYQPDLILMDILIEGDLDGIETANLILAENPIPIVYLTAQADQQTFKRATASTPHGYILKPFQQREIEVTIETVLNRAKMEKVLRNSEAALRKSNEKFERFFANALEGAAFRMFDEPLEWDNHPDQDAAVEYAIHHLKITKVNQAMLDQYRLDEEAFVAMSMADLYPHDPDFLKKIIKQLFILKKLPIEAREQRPDGSHLWVDGNVSCFLTPEGHILGIFILQRDVTQQKLSEALIHTQSHILEKIAKSSPINDTLSDICKNIQQLIDQTSCAILSLESQDTTHNLKVLVAPTLSDAQVVTLESFNLQSHNGQRLLQGEEIIVQDIATADITEKFKQFAKENTWQSSWLIPVVSTSQQLQSILMINCLRSHTPSDLEREVVKTSVSLTALAIERDAAQQRLQKQALTFENLNDALVITDYEGNIQEWNPAARYMFGYARNEISQKNAESIFRSYNLNTKRKNILEALDQQGKWMGEVNFIKKDGALGISKSTVLHLKDENEQKIGILSINRDITDQKETEKALEASQKNLQVIFDNTDQIFVLLNAEGWVQTFNKKALDELNRLWGGQLNEQSNWLNVLPNYMKKMVKRDWDKSLQGVTVMDEARFEAANTKYVYSYSYIPIFDPQGVVNQVCFAATDITDRKLAEIKILESRAKLEALIENTNDGIWSVDTHLNVTTVNTSLQDISKTYLEQEIKPGDNFIEQLPEKFRAHWREIFEKVLQGDRITEEFSLELLHTTIYFELSANPIVNSRGVIKGATAFLKNITRKKEDENDLKRANSELDSFVYRASHDLRAPLRSILGLVSLTRLEPNEEERASYLDMMEKSAKKLDSFIADLTNLSRNSRLEMTIEPINFEELIADTIENHKFMKDADRVSITYDIQNPVQTFHSNESRLGIIFQNMVSNAIKYQNYRVDNPFLKIDIRMTTKGVNIVFEDNGLGIEEKFLQQIFEMFFRATENSYGSGLGLYITKQAIEKIKGRVYVTSEVGHGTTFSLSLPNLENVQLR